MKRKDLADLRSQRWFGQGPLSFEHRAHAMQAGIAPEEFEGRPVIAVVNTWSDLNPCHAHLRARAEAVKRGIWQAGGYPVELFAMSLGEGFVKPTTMLYRNFLAMETEELLRCHPIDGVVLLGGCDKTTPGLLMGAITMDLPAIYVPAGPTLGARFHGERLGSGTGAFRWAGELLAGHIGTEEWKTVERRSWSSPGTCNTMGTASTMTAIAEALGLTLPAASSTPAMDSEGERLAALAGRRIVGMVFEDLRPSAILTEASFRNAARVCAALGGSTNATIHLVALARRAGVRFDLDAFDQAASEIPVLANVQPSGTYLMPDFHAAGGLPALIERLREQLDLGCRTVTGRSLGENVAGTVVDDDDVIRPLDRPVAAQALAVLRGNLAPDGAVIKPSAASPALLRHQGRAVVFHDIRDLEERIHDPSLDVHATSVLVLQNAGPLGGPGMPEVGMLPIPWKLASAGVKDLVRVSDARMSGTSYGTCILHVSPEAYLGGPLALVRDGDEIDLDVPARRLTLRVEDADLAQRRAEWKPPAARYSRGWGVLFSQHVLQAHEGCDFDVLARGEPTPEPDIHRKV
jgi:dihydroxy-acid dehydratase